MYISWTDSSLLSQADLGSYNYESMGYSIEGSSDELVSGLYLARRGFWGEETCENLEGCEALWEKILGENTGE